MLQLGDLPVDVVIDFKWPTFDQTGGSITRSTDGTLRIYKGNSTDERTSAAGITQTEDFDSMTGVHHIHIDTSDDTDTGFYAAGGEYQVVMVGMVVDTKTVNAPIAHFSIERTGGVLALMKARLPTALISGRMASDIEAIHDSATAAAYLQASADTMALGTVDDTAFSPTTTEFESDDITTAGTDHFQGRSIIFRSTGLAKQASSITAYTVTGGRGHFTIAALNAAPANNSIFVIL